MTKKVKSKFLKIYSLIDQYCNSIYIILRRFRRNTKKNNTFLFVLVFNISLAFK